jgi:transposase
MDVRAAMEGLLGEERAVCAALANGDSTTEIAKQLGRSWHAANKLVARIRRHFEVLGLDA